MRGNIATQNRRDFFKTAALIGASAATLPNASTKAEEKFKLSEDRMGALIDTTVCIGCRNCEWACKEAHNLATDSLDTYNDRSVFERKRRPDEYALTVVNEYDNPKNPILSTDVKVQCMHCDDPACVSACIVGAFTKDENGPVTWDSSKFI